MIGFYDPTFILIIPPMLLAMWASFKVKTNFEKYKNIPNKRGYTGEEVANKLLKLNNINDVEVKHINGSLSDHYDPSKKTVCLSDDVYKSNSIAALSVAAHEVGHAIQHNKNYLPLKFRTSLFKSVMIGSNSAMPLFLLGIFLTSFGQGSIGQSLMLFGIVLFVFVVLFQTVTLPVEFNASKRALIMLEKENFLDKDEIHSAKEILSAAALTYVAAAASSIAQLLRLIIIYLNSRDRDR